MTYRDIPGFYYDEEKKRYFKIQKHGPADAEWTVGNVKKRKAEKAKDELKRIKYEKLKYCVKRSSILGNPLAGGRLLREFGVVDPEMPVESWTAGLRQRGEVSFLPGQELNPDAPSISSLLVEGGDKADRLGLAYAGFDRAGLKCAYLPTDKDEKINFGITSYMRNSRLSAIRTEEIPGGISAIAYHQGSRKVIVTSAQFDDWVPELPSRGTISIFKPSRPADFFDGSHLRNYYLEQFGGQRPTWLLGETDAYVKYSPPLRGLTMNAIRLSPASTSGHGLDALIATSQGIMAVGGETAGAEVSWVTPKPYTPRPGEGRNHRQNNGTGGGGSDVFTLDYHPSSPRVCYAGCRNSRIVRVDIRAPTSSSSSSGLNSVFRHRSSAAHVRCLDDHRVLVAGPKSAMAIYDIRWAGPRRSASGHGGHGNLQGTNKKFPQPVVEFAGYRNEAHVKIGLDVTNDAGGVGGAAAGGGGGIVAAAMDDGTVGVFSLRTGRRLRAGAVDELRAPGGGVVKALQFQRLPWEKEASLFAGVGPSLKKFTFGPDDGEDEW